MSSALMRPSRLKSKRLVTSGVVPRARFTAATSRALMRLLPSASPIRLPKENTSPGGKAGAGGGLKRDAQPSVLDGAVGPGDRDAVGAAVAGAAADRDAR